MFSDSLGLIKSNQIMLAAVRITNIVGFGGPTMGGGVMTSKMGWESPRGVYQKTAKRRERIISFYTQK